MNAVWGLDYDMHTDKCYKRPCCPECEAPIFKYGDGTYHCVNCYQVIKIKDAEMEKWLAARDETKVELEDCLFGCNGKKCVEVHYVRNPISLEWQQVYGECRNCGMRFIV